MVIIKRLVEAKSYLRVWGNAWLIDWSYILGVDLSEVGELFQVLVDRVHWGVDLVSLSLQIDGHLRIRDELIEPKAFGRVRDLTLLPKVSRTISNQMQVTIQSQMIKGVPKSYGLNFLDQYIGMIYLNLYIK